MRKLLSKQLLIVVALLGALYSVEPTAATTAPIQRFPVHVSNPPAGGGTPLSRNEHPRIWVTEDNISAIRSRMATGGWLNSEANTWADWLDANYTTSFGQLDKQYYVIHLAFAYLMLRDGALSGVTFDHSASDYGNKAADYILELITLTGGAISDDRTGQYIVAYDWAYPFFSPAERATVIDMFQDADNKSVSPSLGIFNVVQVGFKISRVMGGLASLGDGIDDTWAQAKIDQFDDYFSGDTGGTKMQSFYGGIDGANGEGPSYAYNYHNEWVLLMEEAYRTANGQSIASYYNTTERYHLTQVVRELMYRILPFAVSSAWRMDKGQYNEAGMGLDGIHRNWIQAARRYTHDANIAPLAEWLIDNKFGGHTTSGDTGFLRWWVPGLFVFGPDSEPTASSPTTLSMPSTLATYDGRFIFRDNWTDANASYITFEASKWFTSPYHSVAFGPGTWQIHRRGPQVVNQGGITGHDWGGGRNAGATNTLMFVDTTISTSGIYSDGNPSGGGTLTNSSTPLNAYEALQGPVHRNVTYPQSISDFSQNGFWDARDDFSYVLADRAASRDFDYVLVDHTRTYPSNRYSSSEVETRVSEVIRQFVYLRPATVASTDPDFLFVFDRATTTDTKFERRNIVHTVGDPTVDGSSSAGPSRNGSTAGKTTYTGATVISATNTANSSSGSTWITPLLPTSFIIVKVGGNDSAGNPWTIGPTHTTAGSHEYEDPYGTLWGFTKGGEVPATDKAQYVGGRYRLEIIPTTSNLVDTHLYVVEQANSGASQTAVTGISLTNSTYTGAQVGDRIVVFHKTSSAATSGTFVIPSAGTWRVLITGLSAASSRTVTGGANVSSIQSIDPVDTSSPFTVNTPVQDSVTGATIGGWLYLTIVVGSSGTGAANTITIG
jgi:hypothetical protein